MKNRMYNTFKRKLKNEYIACFIANIGYGVLILFYVIVRMFFKKKSSLSIDDARKKLDEFSPKPEMDCQIINQPIGLDLSIVIPAYNAEKTIKQCLESVVQQVVSYQYEVIVINDGSTDSTKDIVQSISDEHIILINQENRGFSGARNRGIDECTGKYIMFLDSDDYLVGNCIQNMMDKIIVEQADIVQGGHYMFYANSNAKTYCKLMDTIQTEKEEMVCNLGYPWAKIYKRELFEQIRFPLDVWFEDTIVCMLLYRMCHKIVQMSDIVYAYRINPSGITQTARHNKRCVEHYWIMEFVLEKAKQIGLPKDAIQYNLVKGHMSTLMYRRISLMDDEIIEAAFILACDMLNKIRPKGYQSTGNIVNKDIERAFLDKNYKLWKLASFVV